MNISKQIWLFIFLLFATKIVSAEKIRIASPDGNIIVVFTMTEKIPVYQVSYKGKALIKDAELSLTFKENGEWGKSLSLQKTQYYKVDDTYELVVGKTKIVHDHYNQALIRTFEHNGAKRLINLDVKVFNDGVAFRYELPGQQGWSSYTLTEEQSTFRVAGDPIVHTLFRKDYTTSHEGFYSTSKFSEMKSDTLMDLPTLLEFPGRLYVAFTEAALRNYAGMYLMKHDGNLVSRLSPWPGQTEIKVKADLPHYTPWRVIMIGDRMGALIESNILTNLNEPTKIKDLSWIKPGKSTFPWWNGNIIPDTTYPGGNNFETNKYYIDFCARNHIEYHSVVEYGQHEWYVNDGANFVPGPHADVTRTVPGMDMKQICDYAASKGVSIRVWVHWKALYPQLDKAFAQFEKWGIKGMMVDFMDRDDQQMVNIQEEILTKAAEHHLHIQFHGAYKPTGLNRTYPNEFTREGSLNYENDKWLEHGLPPDHDLDIVFIRMLAGATDYHLGGFRAVPDAKFKPQYFRPLMLGTRCHMLAMYVVLESYLQMICDYPEAYKNQPGFDFITEVPTVWDEVRVPDAEVGKYLTIARRKDKNWFVGSLNNHENRTINVSLDFLEVGKIYQAKIYSDAPDCLQNPNHLIISSRKVVRGDRLTLQLAAGGGMVMELIQLTQ